MANRNEPLSLRQDAGFRKGACHGAEWFVETSRTLAAQGRTVEEINEHLADLRVVLAEWRNHAAQLPDGNPWDWSFKDLASVIRANKKQ